MVAGGAVLFSLAIMDIVNPEKKRRIPSKELGAVPLGTPLIVGPTVLTTSLIIIGESPGDISLTRMLHDDKIKVASEFTLDNTVISCYEEHQVLSKA